MLAAATLRLESADRLEWLARTAGRRRLGRTRRFGDGAVAYFTESLDLHVIRRALSALLLRAKRNKAFDRTPRIGLALVGTNAGPATEQPGRHCHPIDDAQGRVAGYLHGWAKIGVAGVRITLPFDVELYAPGDSEYGAGQRLLQRAVNQLEPRFAGYSRVDAKFAAAPFLHTAGGVRLPIVERLRENLSA